MVKRRFFRGNHLGGDARPHYDGETFSALNEPKDPHLTKERDYMTHSYDPKIIAFCCNWCAYAGADLAGVSRLQYPHNLRIIRVMCSGRINPNFILRAFSRGADGVLVAG